MLHKAICWQRLLRGFLCFASVGILRAVLNFGTQEQTFSLPNFKAKIRLPSNRTYWLKGEQSCEGPSIVVYSSDVVKRIFARQKLDIQASDFAFLTIVSPMLSHIYIWNAC